MAPCFNPRAIADPHHLQHQRLPTAMAESLSLAAIDMDRGAPNGHNALAMLARIYGIETELRELSNDERRVGFAPHRKRSRPALTLAEREEISLGLADSTGN